MESTVVLNDDGGNPDTGCVSGTLKEANVSLNGIGWIDFSSEHRDRIWTALDLLAKPGVVDELGIGPIRDALADKIFPGISTIQTRPKYFSLVPLLLRQYQLEELRRPNPRSVDEYLRVRERECRAIMVKAAETESNGKTDQTGIIGATFEDDLDRGVVRRPSSIYWNGLRTFRIFSPPALSLVEFGERLRESRHARFRLSLEAPGDDWDAQDEELGLYVMVPSLVDPKTYWDTLSIALLSEEAEFLQQQIVTSQPDSMLAHLLFDLSTIETKRMLDQVDSFHDFLDFPMVRSLKSSDPELLSILTLAGDFSDLLYGAHIRYNCLLQKRFGTERKCAEFNQLWEEWVDRILPVQERFRVDRLWELTRSVGVAVRGYTKAFVETWITNCHSRVLDIFDRIVTKQEIDNKSGRARLHPNAKESVSDWIGLRRLDYRFSRVRVLVRDIRDALHAQEVQ